MMTLLPHGKPKQPTLSLLAAFLRFLSCHFARILLYSSRSYFLQSAVQGAQQHTHTHHRQQHSSSNDNTAAAAACSERHVTQLHRCGTSTPAQAPLHQSCSAQQHSQVVLELCQSHVLKGCRGAAGAAHHASEPGHHLCGQALCCCLDGCERINTTSKQHLGKPNPALRPCTVAGFGCCLLHCRGLCWRLGGWRGNTCITLTW